MGIGWFGSKSSSYMTDELMCRGVTDRPAGAEWPSGDKSESFLPLPARF